MEVADAGGEKQSADETQHGISEKSMQKRHGTGSDPTPKAVTYDQSVACAQTVDERVEPREIVAVVGVPHYNESPVRHPDSCQKRAAISLLCDAHDACARVVGQLRRSVAGTVVRDKYFAFDAGSLKETARLSYTSHDRLSLVQARHENGQFEGVRVTGKVEGRLRVMRFCRQW